MTSITVTTQADLDAALARDDIADLTICIASPAGVWLRIARATEAHVEARDSSHVEAGGSSHVEAWGTSHVEAWDSSHVVARGSSHVVAGGSSHVEAWGSSHVEAWGSSHVEAWGTSHVEAWDSSHVEAGAYVAVHLHSQRVTLTGGVVIDMTAVDDRDPATWTDLVGARRDGDDLLLYKAVDDDLAAGHRHIRTAYPIGETVTATDWRDDHDCGGGLHVSPTPQQARMCAVTDVTRMLLVRVPMASVRTIGRDKCKAPSLTVVREVALDGSELTAVSA